MQQNPIMMNAVALNVFGMNTARIMAADAAGFLVDTIGFAVIYYIMEFGLRSFGVFLAGLLAEKMGVQWSIGGLTGILVIVSLAAILFAPRIRQLE